MKLCVRLVVQPWPQEWTRVVVLVIIILLARLAGVPAEALPFILGGGMAGSAAARVLHMGAVA